MKKTILAVAFGTMATAAIAQKSQVRAANNFLADNELEKAKTAIEAAVNDESTKNSAYAWYTRGMVYMKMQQQPANEGKAFYNEAGSSFKKVITLDPSYEKENVTNNLFATAIYNFNDGLNAFDKQQYPQAFDHFAEVNSIAGLDGGKRFASNKKLDTIARQSRLYQGYSAYYANRFDDALNFLIAAKADPVTKDANAYLMLGEIYSEQKKMNEAEAIFTEARTAYPDNKAIKNAEINFFIRAGKMEALVKKLEDAVKSEPNNADMWFNLGTTYDGMANPKDKSDNELPKPANFEEFFGKAEAAYQAALKIEPNKTDANYNLGALYYNRAVMVNKEMNDIKGTSAADQKKYDALKATREQWFGKSLPNLEAALKSLDGKPFSSLNDGDKFTYQASIIALKEIYAKQNKMDKVAELKAKQEAMKK